MDIRAVRGAEVAQSQNQSVGLAVYRRSAARFVEVLAEQTGIERLRSCVKRRSLIDALIDEQQFRPE